MNASRSLSILRQVGLVPLGIAFGVSAVVVILNQLLNILTRPQLAYVVLGIIGVGVVVSLIQFFVVKKRVSTEEKARRAAVDSQKTPGLERIIDQIHDRLSRAVGKIKAAPEYRDRFFPSRALYKVPWILIIGQSQAGKTTLVRRSGLQFPHGDPELSPDARPKGSATKNCEFWLANDALVIDTTGRYVHDAGGGDPDLDETMSREEWLGVLKMLRRERPRNTLNGLVVAVSLEALLTESMEDVMAHAKRIRQRIDEAMRLTGSIFPVYLVFTKCDRLDGFEEFMRTADDGQRAAIWGASISPERYESMEPEVAFSEEFKKLHAALTRLRMEKLYRTDDGTARRNVYVFPLEFGALRSRLGEFVATLFAQSHYQDRPNVRGFCFTSAEQPQDGAAPVGAATEVNKSMGFTTMYVSPKTARGQEKDRPYFIRDLFARLILKESALVKPTRTAIDDYKKQKRWGYLASSGAFLAFLFWGLFAHLGNRSILQDLQVHSTNAARIPAPERLDRDSRATMIQGLTVADRLREEIERSESRRSLPPVLLERILYRGHDVERAARNHHRALVQRLLLDPFLRDFEGRVRNGRDYTYPDFRSYVMLTTAGPGCYDAGAVGDYLVDVWLPGRTGGDLSAGEADLIRRQARFLGERELGWLPSGTPLVAGDPGLVDTAARRIRESFGTEAVYQATVADVSSRVPTFDLTELPESGGFLVSRHPVPGAYTAQGWSAFQTMMATGGTLDDCASVLVAGGAATTAAPGVLAERYFDDYEKHWMAFLDGLDVRALSNLREAEDLLGRVADRNSLMKFVMERVLDQALLSPEGAHRADIDRVNALFAGLVSFLPPESLGGRSAGVLGRVTGRSEDPPLQVYTETHVTALRDLVRTIRTAESSGLEAEVVARDLFTRTREVSAPIDDYWVWCQEYAAEQNGAKDAVRDILLAPGRRATQIILANARFGIDQLWDQRVHAIFDATLANRYPLRESGSEVLLEDFESFFAPEAGAVWGTFESVLSPYVTDHTQDWSLRSWRGLTVPIGRDFRVWLARAHGITEAYFTRSGDLQVEFQVTPRPYSLEGSVDPGVRSTTFQCDTQEITYTSGQALPRPFVWPGETTGRAMVSVATEHLEAPEPVEGQGPWGLFQVLDRASRDASRVGEVHFSWVLRRPGRYGVHVTFVVEPSRRQNPFEENLLYGLTCPETAGG